MKLTKAIGITVLTHIAFVALLLLLGLNVWNAAFYVAGVLLGIAFLIGDEQIFQTWYQLDRPFSKTFLFLLVYLPMLLFVLTSSGSYLASGILLAIGVLKVVSYVLALLNPQLVEVPRELLVGGEKPFTRSELQNITGLLVILLIIFAIRMIMYV
jgi:hypothetical protein